MVSSAAMSSPRRPDPPRQHNPDDRRLLGDVCDKQLPVSFARQADGDPLTRTEVHPLPVVDIEPHVQSLVRFCHEGPYFRPVQRNQNTSHTHTLRESGDVHIYALSRLRGQIGSREI